MQPSAAVLKHRRGDAKPTASLRQQYASQARMLDRLPIGDTRPSAEVSTRRRDDPANSVFLAYERSRAMMLETTSNRRHAALSRSAQARMLDRLPIRRHAALSRRATRERKDAANSVILALRAMMLKTTSRRKPAPPDAVSKRRRVDATPTASPIPVRITSEKAKRSSTQRHVAPGSSD